METVPQQDENLSLDPSRSKSEDSSPDQDGSGKGSPPPNCAICLGKCRNNSFTDTCLHQFCFNCLLTWSKVKAECPLCKQGFKSIIYNLQPNFHYEQYHLDNAPPPPPTPPPPPPPLDAQRFVEYLAGSTGPRFRYRTTVTLPRHTSTVLREFFTSMPRMRDAVFAVPSLPSLPTYSSSSAYPSSSVIFPHLRNTNDATGFRRTVYQHNLWARPLPDITGRFRECTPHFYSQNVAQVHRLIPWINRELNYLMNRNAGHIPYVLARIMDLLFQHNMESVEFVDALRCYLGDRSEHFVHELRTFAATAYDLQGYDRHVQYSSQPPPPPQVIISSSESDSDSVMVLNSQPTAGPSRPRRPLDLSVAIETISQSDTDDDNDDVMVIGYIKPPQQRTPEVVDLLDSEVDSDVIIQDAPDSSPPAPQVYHNLQRLVKVSLKRHRAARTPRTPRDLSTDSEDEIVQPVRTKVRRRRVLSSPAASTEATRGDTPPPRLDYVRTPSPAESTECGSSWSSDTKPRKRKKTKCKRKGSSKKSRHKKSKRSSSPDRGSRSKQKSISGKGVKSSKKSRTADQESAASHTLDQPSTSGTREEHRDKRIGRSHESKRLKSVVTVQSATRNEINSGSTTPPYPPADMPYKSCNTSDLATAGTSATRHNYDFTDSEDDIPLNLTIRRIRAALQNNQDGQECK